MRSVEQVSAGGVVFRGSGSDAEIVIIKTVPEDRWQLPKGLIDRGETAEQAALREVREESGIDAELVAPIERIQYWFVAAYSGERRKYHKFVHFFLMRFAGGDVSRHDDEVSEARWVTFDDALQMLAFPNERDVVTKARDMIRTTIALSPKPDA
jgi:8-oxo-dGTP pyrophosphatase MutT (NUDIX family)